MCWRVECSCTGYGCCPEYGRPEVKMETDNVITFVWLPIPQWNIQLRCGWNWNFWSCKVWPRRLLTAVHSIWYLWLLPLKAQVNLPTSHESSIFFCHFLQFWYWIGKMKTSLPYILMFWRGRHVWWAWTSYGYRTIDHDASYNYFHCSSFLKASSQYFNI